MAVLKQLFAAALCLSSTLVHADLVGLPTVPFTAAKGNQSLDLTHIQRIIVDSRYAQTKDENGWTLIPPTLNEFVQTFAQDHNNLYGRYLGVQSGSRSVPESIFLTIGNDSEFKDVAGRWTSEAYKIEVKSDRIVVTGASPLGVWWGTRTILQQASLNGAKIAVGSGVDSPGWNTRGVFLDAGRHYYPPSFLIEMCSWMSYWKQNTFHVHLSDNLYNNVDIYSYERQMELYAAFRPWSDDPALAGLNKRRNESYTREQFDEIQQSCAARGVTIIPEIEAPGHALVITQWKPELAIETSRDLLNISYPETIPQMEAIWKTMLPWFHSKVVHIGADEYVDAALTKNALVAEYNRFVIALDDYIKQESGKSIRIWGTFPPMSNYTNNISKDVTVQHWEFFEDNPYFDYIKQGYNVINSDDQFYIVQKYSTSYPQELNKTRIFHGNPDGSAWSPNIFDQTNATNNPPRDSPYVVGHIAAQWNDYGPNTSTYLEAYNPFRYYLPALADKQWGGKITEEQYDSIYPTLQAAAPAQNLDRIVHSKSSTILSYKFGASPQPQPYGQGWGWGHHGHPGGGIRDISGNNYNANTSCSIANGALQLTKGCAVTTPLTSKGNDYTLSFTLKQASKTPGPLFTGPDSELRSGNGSSSQIMLVSAGNAFALNYSLPVGQWVDASLIGRGNQTFFSVNNGTEMEFLTKVGVNGESFAWARIAVVAPLQTIGGGSWEGEMGSVMLVDHA